MGLGDGVVRLYFEDPSIVHPQGTKAVLMTLEPSEYWNQRMVVRTLLPLVFWMLTVVSKKEPAGLVPLGIASEILRTASTSICRDPGDPTVLHRGKDARLGVVAERHRRQSLLDVRRVDAIERNQSTSSPAKAVAVSGGSRTVLISSMSMAYQSSYPPPLFALS